MYAWEIFWVRVSNLLASTNPSLDSTEFRDWYVNPIDRSIFTFTCTFWGLGFEFLITDL
jgi:hypothetical protein